LRYQQILNYLGYVKFNNRMSYLQLISLLFEIIDNIALI